MGSSFGLIGSALGGLAGLYGVAVDGFNLLAIPVLGIIGSTLGYITGGILAIPTTLLSHKSKMATTVGITTKNSNIYLKPQLYFNFLKTLTHETTHSITLQISPETMQEPYLCEGLADIVAGMVCLSEAKNDYHFRKVINFESHHLLNAYHDLCDELNIAKNSRMFVEKDNSDKFKRKMTRSIFAPYYTGFSAISLLQDQYGKEIVREIVGTNS